MAIPAEPDLEEAVRQLPTPTFLLNGVAAPDGLIQAVVAGHLELAFRAGAHLARPWFHVEAPRAGLVIASDALPVTASLYQAAKIAAAVAPLVAPGGTLALVAECAEGIEPLAVVNEAIFRIGILPRLPPGASIRLVSSLDPSRVAGTLVGPRAPRSSCCSRPTAARSSSCRAPASYSARRRDEPRPPPSAPRPRSSAGSRPTAGPVLVEPRRPHPAAQRASQLLCEASR